MGVMPRARIDEDVAVRTGGMKVRNPRLDPDGRGLVREAFRLMVFPLRLDAERVDGVERAADDDSNPTRTRVGQHALSDAT